MCWKPISRVDAMPWFWAGLLLGGLALLTTVAGYDGLYGQDAYAHLNYAIDIQEFWRSGTPLGSYQWPRLYAFLGALWPWGDPRCWMQFLSMAGAALTLSMLIKILQRPLPEARWVPALTFAFVGLSPLLVRNSLSVMADAPALGVMTAALWLGMQYQASGKPLKLPGAALLAGAAILLRYPVALALFFPVLSWLGSAIRRRDLSGLSLFLPAMMVAALPQLLLPEAAGEGLSQPFQHQHFIQWTPTNYFGRDFVQKDGHNVYPIFNLAAVLGIFWHPRYLGLGLLGVLGWFFRRNASVKPMFWIACGAIVVNVLFLAGIPFQNPRFLLPILPFVAILLAASWDFGFQRLFPSRRMQQIAFLGILTVQVGLCLWSSKLPFAVSANEKMIADDLKAIPNQGQRLYELSFEAMLKARNVPLEEVNMWYGPLEPPQKGDLVLFNLKAFEGQFKGMWPMKNWEMLGQNHTLRVHQEWKEGWKLYVID